MTAPHNLLFNALFRSVGRIATCDIGETLVVAGHPRSGTSWTASIFGAAPGRKVFFEPLNDDPRAERAGFDEPRPYLAPGNPVPRARRYMQSVLSGEISRPWFLKIYDKRKRRDRWWDGLRTRWLRLRKHASCRKLVVKMVQANRLLPWLERQFDVQGIVFIVRHPCAVVASQLSMPNSVWQSLEPPSRDRLQEGFGGWIPDDLFARFRTVLASVDSTTGVLAASWCLHHYIPLLYADDNPWTLLPYERLLTQGEKELQRVTGAVGEPFHPAMRRVLNSQTATGDQVEKKTEQQLTKWKRRLTSSQIDTVLRLTEAFELDFYDEQPEPDYERLMQFQKPEVKAA